MSRIASHDNLFSFSHMRMLIASAFPTGLRQPSRDVLNQTCKGALERGSGCLSGHVNFLATFGTLVAVPPGGMRVQ